MLMEFGILYLIFGLVSILVSFSPIAAIVFFVLWLNARNKIKEKNKVISTLVDSSPIIEPIEPAKPVPTVAAAPHKQLEHPHDTHKDQTVHHAPVKQVPTMATATAISQPVIIEPMLDLDDPELKAKRAMQNINIALYIASFLIVAAVSIFITTSDISQQARFAVIALVTTGFYATGLILYKQVIRLRPAGVAFVATGLATLPFIGVAAYQFILTDVNFSWFITSIVGLVAYVIAALIMRNQVISYLSIAFVISTVLSATSISHAPLIAYFVVMIVFGTSMSILAMFAKKIIPQVFIIPVENTNEWIVPVTLGASIFSYFSLNLNDYVVLSALGAAYYLAIGLASVEKRGVGLYLSRILAIISILIAVYDNGESFTAVGVAMTIIGAVNVISSIALFYVRQEKDSFIHNDQWLIIGLVMQLIAPFLVLSNSNWSSYATAQILIMISASLAAALFFRRIVYSVFATIGLAVLPLIIGFALIDPRLDAQYVALVFIALSIATVVARVLSKNVKSNQLGNALYINFGIYSFEALSLSIGIKHEWGIAIWLISIVSVLFITYYEKQYLLSILANLMLFIMVYIHVAPYNMEPWILPLSYLVASAVAIGAPYLLSKKIPGSLSSTLLLHSGLFIVQSLLFSANVNNTWGAVIWIANSLLMVGLAYVSKIPYLSIIGNLLFSFAMWRYVFPDTSYQLLASVFAVFSGVMLLARRFLPIKTDSALHTTITANLALLMLQSLFSGYNAPDVSWTISILIINSLFTYALVYLERLPFLVVGANLLVSVALYKLPELLGTAADWRPCLSAALTVGWLAAGYAALRYLGKTRYSGLFLASLVIPNLYNGLILLSDDKNLVLASGGVAFASLVVLMVESIMIRNYQNIAVVIVFMNLLAQRVFYMFYPDADKLFYPHWWALVTAGIAVMMYFLAKKPQIAMNLLYVTLGLITFPTAFAALNPSSWSYSALDYQTIFIVEQALILAAGLLLKMKPVSIWGGVGIVLSVVWLIRGFGPALLVLIAVVLIGLAIYALLRQSKSTAKKHSSDSDIDLR